MVPTMAASITRARCAGRCDKADSTDRIYTLYTLFKRQEHVC